MSVWTARTFTLLGLMLAVLMASGCQPAAVSQAAPQSEQAAATVRLVFDPAEVTITPGEEFMLTVNVEAGKEKVDAVQISIDYGSAAMKILEIKAGDALSTPLLNQYDNSTGTLDYAAGILPPAKAPTGTFKLAEIRFSAVAESPQVDFSIQYEAPRQTGVFYQGTSILDTGSLAGARVIIKPIS
jgi:hypothetical protein